MATYNGHKNWAYWNVSLWINNDEGLYKLALQCIKDAREQNRYKPKARNRETAAKLFLARVSAQFTPDHAKYTQNNVYAAMKGM